MDASLQTLPIAAHAVATTFGMPTTVPPGKISDAAIVSGEASA